MSQTPLLEEKYVHSVYNKIAHQFTDSRYRHRWKGVSDFLLSLSPGSVVADVGCGLGKYLGVNPSIVVLGCDPCIPLLSLAAPTTPTPDDLLQCQAHYLPLRDASCDAVLSIGVLHHFSTPTRRQLALTEMARILRPGGHLLIYAWAFEQSHRSFPAQDLLVPWDCKDLASSSMDHSVMQASNSHSLVIRSGDVSSPIDSDLQAQFPEFKVRQFPQSSCPHMFHDQTKQLTALDILKIPINSISRLFSTNEINNTSNGRLTVNRSHTSNTYNLQHSDPFYRFYHVFRKGEIETLINDQVPELVIVKSELDHSNWKVLAVKNNTS